MATFRPGRTYTLNERDKRMLKLIARGVTMSELCEVFSMSRDAAQSVVQKLRIMGYVGHVQISNEHKFWPPAIAARLNAEKLAKREEEVRERKRLWHIKRMERLAAKEMPDEPKRKAEFPLPGPEVPRSVFDLGRCA